VWVIKLPTFTKRSEVLLGEKNVFRENRTGRTYRIQEGNCPSRKADSSCTDHQREMTFEKYLGIEGVFLAESQYS